MYISELYLNEFLWGKDIKSSKRNIKRLKGKVKDEKQALNKFREPILKRFNDKKNRLIDIAKKQRTKYEKFDRKRSGVEAKIERTEVEFSEYLRTNKLSYDQGKRSAEYRSMMVEKDKLKLINAAQKEYKQSVEDADNYIKDFKKSKKDKTSEWNRNKPFDQSKTSDQLWSQRKKLYGARAKKLAVGAAVTAGVGLTAVGISDYIGRRKMAKALEQEKAAQELKKHGKKISLK